LDNLIYRRWLPYASKQVDAIITVSQSSKADIMKYLHAPDDKVHVVPPGIHTDFQPASRLRQRNVCEKYHLSQPYILYVGSIEKRKNLVRVLKAFSQFYQKRQSHRLVIVGPKKWHYTLIENVFNEIDVGDSIIFTGYVAQEDLPVIYSAADLFIYPALYEGFGLPVLEAMACGTPVITSNVSSLPEVAGDAALLVDPYDVDAIETALHEMIEDETLRVQMKERGLQRAKRYVWRQTAEQTLLVYQTILG
jgi:glycosyltransferase involved in cell wall biosynthesis